MPAAGTWRHIVNSFRFAIRRTVDRIPRVLRRSRKSRGWRYLSWRSRFTEWPVVCEESRRSPDLCAQWGDALVPSRRFSRYVCAYSVRTMDEEWTCEGKIATVLKDRKETGTETPGRKEWQWRKRKGGLRRRRVWMDERAAIYDRRIADRVAFKIDPVFQRLANRSEPCASSSAWRPIVASRLFARASRRS